jgi:hypothetical protein
LQSSVRASQETHYVSATKPNRLMLFREIIAVYCENHMKHGKMQSLNATLECGTYSNRSFYGVKILTQQCIQEVKHKITLEICGELKRRCSWVKVVYLL